jgi:Leucine-rich repeat (LRR) protein
MSSSRASQGAAAQRNPARKIGSAAEPLPVAPASAAVSNGALSQEHRMPKNVDFSYDRSRAFTFPELPLPQSSAVTISGVQPNEIEHAPSDRETGIFDLDFNVDAYNRERSEIRYNKYVPSTFTRKNLRPIDQFAGSERVMDMGTFLSPAIHPGQITFLSISGEALTLNGRNRADLVQRVQLFQNLEVLQLTALGLRNVEALSFQHLLFASFVNNQISETSGVLRFCMNCNALKQADFRLNPVVEKKAFRDKIIAQAQHLLVLNNVRVELKHRSEALKSFGSEEDRKYFDYLKWDSRICDIKEFGRLPRWDPTLVVNLNLQNLQLRVLLVGDFCNMKELNVSSNWLQQLTGFGLERCNRLQTFDLRKNFISDQNELHVFHYMPSILSVFLAGNKFTTNYKHHLIVITRYLPGTQLSQGVQHIDGQKVSLIEKLHAFRDPSSGVKGVDFEHWKSLLIHSFGHRNMQQPHFFSRLRRIDLENKGGVPLGYANVEGIQMLEWLDLSHHDLKHVAGLETCLSLRVLILNGNASLDLKKTLMQFTSMKRLEAVSLFNPDHKMRSLPSYRIDVLRAIIFNNRAFCTLDGFPVSVEERVQAHNTDGSEVRTHAYRSRLCLVQNVLGEKNRAFHPDEVNPGVVYQPDKVIELPFMARQGIVHSIAFPSLYDLRLFVNLLKLNIKGNKVKTLHNMGLEQLTKLVVFDFTENEVSDKIKEVASILNTMVSLSILACRKNPFMDSASDRITLIGMLSRMHDINCSFRVVDTEVTVEERVTGWRQIGRDERTCEQLRYKATLYLSTPPNTPLNEVTTLNLENSLLKELDLGAYTGLKFLYLRRNRLDQLDTTGISTLFQLEEIDLRDNAFKNLDQVLKQFNKLLLLKSIGLSGNKFSDGWRKETIKFFMPRLEQPSCPLRTIDDEEIKVDDICGTLEKSGKAGKFHLLKIRFEISLQRYLMTAHVGGLAANLTILNLSNAGLAYVALHAFVALKHLDMSHNQLTDLNITESGIAIQAQGGGMSLLNELVLTHNRLSGIDQLFIMIDALPALNKLRILDGCPMSKLEVAEKEKRVALISKLKKMQDVGAVLTELDSEPISIAERCEALFMLHIADAAVGTRRSEELRFKLHLETQRKTVHAVSLCVSGIGLKALVTMETYRCVRFADFSMNSIQNLSPLASLPLLSNLDVRHNAVSSFEEALRMLCKCHALRHVHLLKVAADQNEDAKSHCTRAFAMLPALLSCDGTPNSTPYTSGQMAACRLLKTRYSIGPNEVVHLDLNKRGIDSHDFELLKSCVSMLPVVTLKVKEGNPFFEIANVRFVLLFIMPTLIEIDGEAVTATERHNAEDFVRKLVDKGAYKPPDPPGTGLIGQRLFNKSSSAGASGAGSSGAAATGASDASSGLNLGLSKFETTLNFGQIQGLVTSLSIPFGPFVQSIKKIISPLMFEIDIIFPQLKDICYWELIKTIGFILIPMIVLYLYKMPMLRRSWDERYNAYWLSECGDRVFIGWRLRLFLILIFMLILSSVVAYAIDYIPCQGVSQYASFDRLLKGQAPTALTIGWICILGGFSFLLWFLNAILVALFRRRIGQENKLRKFWDTLTNVAKKRVALTFLTVSYLPLANIFIQNLSAVQVTRALFLDATTVCLTLFALLRTRRACPSIRTTPASALFMSSLFQIKFRILPATRSPASWGSASRLLCCI